MAPVLSASLHRHTGALLGLLFPPSWVSCGKSGKWICQSRASQFVLKAWACPVYVRHQDDKSIWPSCMSVSHKLDGIYAIFRFEGPLLLALHRFKHRIAHFLASSLAQLMADRVSQLRANSVPVPVPLHSMRLLESGDNQSELFAVELASMYNLDIQISTLQRVLNTALQARLTDAAKRIINLSGAFKMAGRHLNDRRVIIVDNVCTTRTNLDSCAVALKKGVAQIVHAPVLAHEVSIGIF